MMTTTGTPLRCGGTRRNGRPCGNLLGWIGAAGRLTVKTGGRIIGGIVVTPGLWICCEHCHTRWTESEAGTAKSA